MKGEFRLVACHECGRFACMFGDRQGLRWFLHLDGSTHDCWTMAKLQFRPDYEDRLRALGTMYDVLAVVEYLPPGVAAPQLSLWDD